MFPGWDLSLGDEYAAAIQRQLLADDKFSTAFGPNGIQRWPHYEETGINRTRPCYMIVVQGWRFTRGPGMERGEIDILEVIEYEERNRALLEIEASPAAVFERRNNVIQRAGGLRDGNSRLLPNYSTKLSGWTSPVQPGMPEKRFYAAGFVFTHLYERDIPRRPDV